MYFLEHHLLTGISVASSRPSGKSYQCTQVRCRYLRRHKSACHSSWKTCDMMRFLRAREIQSYFPVFYCTQNITAANAVIDYSNLSSPWTIADRFLWRCHGEVPIDDSLGGNVNTPGLPFAVGIDILAALPI